MTDKQPEYKTIKLQFPIWQEIKELSEELMTERGRSKEDMTQVIAEAIKFFKNNRPKAD